MKIEIDDALKIQLKIECAKIGKPQQHVIGQLIAHWVRSQESKR